MLALLFRKVAHWTTGFAFERALDHLGIEYSHVDNNDVHSRKVSLRDFDAALWVDDGFAMKNVTLHHLPSNNAAFLIDVHNEPDAYLPYLGQFKYIYCAQYTYGVKLVERAGYNNDYVEPNFWRHTPITFVASWSTEQRIYMREIVQHKYKGIAEEIFRDDLGTALSYSKVGLSVLGGNGHHTHYGHVNQRPFEVAGCGALLLHQELWNPFTGEVLPDFEMCGFKPAQAWFRNADERHHFWDRRKLNGDENCVVWRDASQLLHTIDYYLDDSNKTEREEIAGRGQELVSQKHKYLHRTETILRSLGYDV